jgi:hypothetical protein
MAENTYQKAFDEAVKEFQGLFKQRADIDARLDQLRGIILSLGRLIGDESVIDSDVNSTGLTGAVANVLSGNSKKMTPGEIRDQLALSSFDIDRYKAIIPSIVKVLERLHEKRHVEISETKRGGKTKKVYRWKTFQPRALSQSFNVDEFLMEIGKPMKPITEE